MSRLARRFTIISLTMAMFAFTFGQLVVNSQPSVRHMSSGPVNSKEGKVLHPDLLNENLKKTQYAVRGELYIKAEELRKAGREIIFTNGMCNSLAQASILVAELSWLILLDVPQLATLTSLELNQSHSHAR